MKHLALSALLLTACAASQAHNRSVPIAAVDAALSDVYALLDASVYKPDSAPYMSVWWSIRDSLRHDPDWLQGLLSSHRIRALCNPRCIEAGRDTLFQELYVRPDPHRTSTSPDTLLIEAGMYSQHPPTWSAVYRFYTLVRRVDNWVIADRSEWGFDH